MILRQIASVTSVGALALLTACAPVPRAERRIEPVAVAPVPAPRYANYAELGQVSDIQVIPVATRGSPGVGGAVLGAVLGGVIGNQFGKGGGRAAATGIGAVGGAVVGNNIQQRRTRDETEVYRVSVRFDNGAVRAYDFQRIDDLNVGDRVKWEEGQLHRL